MGIAEDKKHDKEALVSVIIPAYYSGAALRESAESVLRQTYPDIQLIVCDDGTEGFSAEDFKAGLRQGNPMIECIVHHHSENLGTVQNLCIGMEFAEGEWVLLLAADDFLANENVIWDLMNQVKQQTVSWVVPKTAMENAEGPFSPDRVVSEIIASGDREKLYEKLCFCCCLPSSGGLYRRRLLEDMGKFDRRFHLVEDWPLFFKLVRDGIMPAESETVAVFRRKGGVSHDRAGRNYAYQRDLIQIMKSLILPGQDRLPPETRKKLNRWVQDKEAIFQMRFSCRTRWEKFCWFFTHKGVVLRKIMRGGPKI